MSSIEFLRPRLSGGRFADRSIPLSFFADLIALREMVIEVAGWRYIKEHPDRQRLPRGFSNSVDLTLTGLMEGSAVPVINLTTANPVLNGVEPPYRQAFEMARDDIINAIATQGRQDTAANEQLPSRFLAYFNRIGRSLRDDECMELSSPGRTAPARLTLETRERLLQQSTITELTREITVRGAISEADQDRMTFQLQQIHGRKIVGAIPEQHRATIVKAFGGYRDNVRVLVCGIGRYDRRHYLSGLETVDHITLLDPLDVPARLDEFRAMKDGWMDGEGLAPNHVGLDWLAAAFERHFPDEASLPYTYPTPTGGVQLEWSLGIQDISLEINLETHQAQWHRLDMASDIDDEKDLNLNDATDWKWLSTEIVHWEESI